MMLILPGLDLASKSYMNFKMQDINFDILKDDIQQMVQHQGFSNDLVVAALAKRDFRTSTRSLKQRLAS
jgi:hypothetical protein